MRYVHIDMVEPGQQLGKPIFTANGTVLLANGVELTTYMLSTLRRIGVTMLYIRDPNFADVQHDEIVSDYARSSVLKSMSGTLEAIRSGKEMDSRAITKSIDSLLEEISRNRELLLQLSDIRTNDNAQYIHALNVSMMSALIGINMNLNHTQLKDLVIGAMLHDIGKVGLSGGDDPTDPRKQHTWRGFELIKAKRDFTLMVAHIALQHHEAIDGSGFPRSLTDEQIHLYAKIVAVANTFDNLMYDTDSGRQMLPHEAIEMVMALTGKTLDINVVRQFMRSVSVYPTGVSVQLSTNESGVVVGQHRGLPGRPIVRVIRKEDEQDIEIKEIDLASHPTVFIEAVLT